MMLGLRLFRLAGLVALALVALAAAGERAFAQTVVGITPNSGSISGGTSVTITGFGFTGLTVSSVSIGGAALNISSATVDVLGILTITGTTTSDGTLPTPTVSSISPNNGGTGGGTSVTITGTNFADTVDVVVNTTSGGTYTLSNGFTYDAVTGVSIGGTAASSFTVTSPTTITLNTPPGIAGVASVVVTSAGSENSGSSGNNLYAYTPGGPSITAIGPTFGLTSGGNQVTITGSNFVPGTYANGSTATSATIGGNPLTNVVVTNTTTLTGTAPAGTAGAADVKVTTPAGTTDGGYLYLYEAPATPVVASVVNTSGPAPLTNSNTGYVAGGAQVTISGSDFTGATSVTFGGTKVNSFNLTGPGTITTATPAHAAGTVDVLVTVTAGANTYTSTPTSSDQFVYVTPVPTVTAIAPSAGSTAGGTAVTITGQYFTGATAVTIGGTAVTSYTVVSDTQITAKTAAHPAGTVDVVVTTASGTGTGTGLYTYGTPVPTVTSVSPSSGSTAGGQSGVIITGQYFTGATAVTFGGTAVTSYTVNSDTQITVTTPAHAAGIVDVAVTTAVGTGTGTSLYTYTAAAPTVTAISPTSGTTLGGTPVTITGTNFSGTPQVTIGGVAAAEVTVVNSTTLTAVTPAGTGSNVPVVVTTSFGTSAAQDLYTYVAPAPPTEPPPTVTGVAPNTGTTLGGTPVTITGTNFTGATAVTFGGNAATNVIVVSPTSITALTPPGSGVVNVAVTTPGGTGTGTALYTYVTVAPTVTAVTPNTGTALGGTTVTITGTNFTGATAVKFGASAATSFTVLTATTITATTPPGTGVVNVAVTTPAGTGVGTNLFTYVTQSPPTVTAITPNGGSIANGGTVAGGTAVTITGTNFTGATAVTIGGNAATFMTVVNATTITAITPAHAPGLVNVVVTTPAGTGTGANLFTYVEGPPTVTGISPNSGPTTGNTFVTITGTNFTGATSVEIGGSTPVAVTFVSSTTITATTTAHAAGLVNVAVTTPAGTGVGTNLFTFVSAAPTVTAVSPNTGPPGGGTSVTITGTNFTGATAVSFGGKAAASFAVNSPTTITATAPPGSGSVDVTVVTPAGTSATSSLDKFTYGKTTTSLTLSSSPNPSSYGQPVTFTALVIGNSPTGTVTFSENGRQLGTATLVHVSPTSSSATFAISTLPVGADPVTASYGGDANNAPDPETVTQYVNAPTDSIKLRELQLAAMPIVANTSAQAITNGIDSAIGAGFAGSCATLTPNGSGFTYCFDGGPPQAQAGPAPGPQQARSRVDDDFAALGYADGPPGTRWAAPPNITLAADLTPNVMRPAVVPYAPPHDWLAWIDLHGTDFDRTTVGNDLKGLQANAMVGVTRRFSPNLLIGVTGGYENFDYTSQAYNGALRGQGFTGGAYLGWRLGQYLRFETAGTWSDIFVDDTSGTASGKFTGQRWLAFGNLTGNFGLMGLSLEPSAQVYTLWEHENAYTDSLGTFQASHDFDTGRASGGLKASHAFPLGSTSIAPYLGFYGDYYFTVDNATAPGLAPVPLLQGWAARATGGLTATFGGGAQVGAGVELSGIGNDTRIWAVSVRGSVPF